jgi:hypothetical protein
VFESTTCLAFYALPLWAENVSEESDKPHDVVGLFEFFGEQASTSDASCLVFFCSREGWIFTVHMRHELEYTRPEPVRN